MARKTKKKTEEELPPVVPAPEVPSADLIPGPEELPEVPDADPEVVPDEPDVPTPDADEPEVPKTTFGEALDLLKAGGRAKRLCWGDNGMWIGLHQGDEHVDAAHFFCPAGGSRRSWHPGMSDILADDWTVA